ncbi:MAG: sugar ABC transporter permease, partial [Sciscionella sp.]
MTVATVRPSGQVAGSPTSPKARTKALRREGWRRRAPLLPALVFLIIVTQLPFVATVVISFRRWNALDPLNEGWAGVQNYRHVFTDSALR